MIGTDQETRRELDRMWFKMDQLETRLRTLDRVENKLDALVSGIKDRQTGWRWKVTEGIAFASILVGVLWKR